MRARQAFTCHVERPLLPDAQYVVAANIAARLLEKAITLAAFVGRAAIRENGYAPPAEVHGVLSEGRDRLKGLTFEGEGRHLRVEILTELDKAINEVRPRLAR